MRYFSNDSTGLMLYIFLTTERNLNPNPRWEINVINISYLEFKYMVILTYRNKDKGKSIYLYKTVSISDPTRKNIAKNVIKLRKEIIKSLKDESSKYVCKDAYIWDKSRAVHV